MNIVRRFERCGDVDIHLREAGDSRLPPLILLHPSPRSSRLYLPWMPALADVFRVVAVDIPGYGLSDAMPVKPTVLADYVPMLHELFHRIAGDRFLLYGSATGAQLGIAYSNMYPARVAHLFLDNAAHFDEDERARILAHYFPDLRPADDGAHFVAAWDMASKLQQFFPWFETDEQCRIGPEPPTADTNALALELLNAGTHYDTAYRLAFEHERAENVQRLRVPATVFRWQGSILLRQIDKLMSFQLPENVRFLHTPAPMGERFQVMKTAFLQAARFQE